MDTTDSDSGLVTITGAEYARLREIDNGPYTFVWTADGRFLCEPQRTIEEARDEAEYAIAGHCEPYRGDAEGSKVIDEILASVGFVVRPDVEHFLDRYGCISTKMWGVLRATPVKATIDTDGSVTIVGP
jgi:hypothetical protein